MGNFINADGYFYNEYGEYIDRVGKSDKVYLADMYEITAGQNPKTGNKKTTISYSKVTELDITHDQFIYISGIVMAEDSSTWQAAAGVSQATYNCVKYIKDYDGRNKITIVKQSEYAKTLLASSYSSVANKKALLDFENNKSTGIINNNRINAKNARKGLIHVLLEREDLTKGAVRWDGIDFASKGITHPKAVQDGISITNYLWIQFVNACEYKSDKNGVLRLNRGNKEKDKTKEEALATIPFIKSKVEISNIEKIVPQPFLQKTKIVFGIKLVKNIDFYETVGRGNNAGRVLNIATVVLGKQIFWRAYKEHVNNEGYYWKSFLGNTLNIK